MFGLEIKAQTAADLLSYKGIIMGGMVSEWESHIDEWRKHKNN